ncbi:MAG: PTS sugar transporter subunit IIA [Candidatus Latescibacterota bacterium]
MKLSELITEKLVISSIEPCEKKVDVLKAFVRLFAQAGLVGDAEECLYAIRQREQIESTAIGEGVAIPHGRSETVKKLAIAFGRSKEGIAFDALDKKPVHLLFMIVSPTDAQGGYLQAVAKIARLLKNKALKVRLMEAETPEDAMAVIRDFDGRVAPDIEVETREGRVIHR